MSLKQLLESYGCYDVKPCKVKLGKMIYSECCEYKQDRLYAEKPYTIQAIYIVGKLHRPKCHMHYNNRDNFDHWYCSGYWQNGYTTDFQPFPYHWLLMPWNVPGTCGNIGITVNMTIEYL